MFGLKKKTPAPVWGPPTCCFCGRRSVVGGCECSRIGQDVLVLEALKSAFRGLDTRVFGSSVRTGQFRLRAGSAHDVDIAVVVTIDQFARWSELAYGRDPERLEFDIAAPGSYDTAAPSRSRRLPAAVKVLGLGLGVLECLWSTDSRLDLFLFPQEFVEGRLAIPAWEREPRNFRAEVLASWKRLDELEV